MPKPKPKKLLVLDQDFVALSEIADYLVLQLDKYQVCLLDGEIGAGKTTLISLILKKLDFKGPVNSPTFGKMHEYETSKFLIYHFDLYRASPSIWEFEEILLNQNTRLLIEWANKLPNEHLNLLQEIKTLQIQISLKPTGERLFEISF